ncbi:MAG: glycosyltransferase family 4 protein [Pseudomonadota bacterium]|nr:glycosyltransferase family 4 protein [Pseudomonadota bacterium]
MKILHTEASLGYGGQEMRIVKEAQGMAQLGHELTLLCPKEAQIASLARDHGLNVQMLPIGRKKISAVLALRRWLKETPQNVINTHSSTDSWLVALATRMLTDRPAIVRTRHISAPIPNNFSSRWLYTKSCEHVVTTGEKLRQTLININHYPAEQITSVRTGIDLDYFCPADKSKVRHKLGLDQAHFIIGIVATLRSWKGHRYLIKAFSRFSDKNSRLLIVGDGPQWDALHTLVDTLGLRDRVIFTNRQQNIAEWMNAMDVFCLPSYANEGVPQALMQSQACGIPAITTLNGSINEAVIPDKTALIVEPRDSNALLDAFEHIYKDNNRLSRMSAAAHKNARQNFSRQQMIEQMESVFTAAIESKPAK